MHTIKILYLRPFSYKAYGAEEQDLKAGLTILRKIKDFEILDIQLDLKNNNLLFDPPYLISDYKLNLSDKLKYIKNKFLTFDRAMTQAYTYKNYQIITQIRKNLRIDVIFTNTVSMVLFGDSKQIKHIHRSVSFEPIYVLKAVDSKIKAILHSLLKLLSIRKELKCNTILSISPRDANYYKRLRKFMGSCNIEVVPLRQFFNFKENAIIKKMCSQTSFGFLGSTYNVLHNRKSLEFVLSEIPPNFWGENDIFLNIYGRKIPVGINSNGNIKINNWVDSIEDIYRQNICFLVPFFLASGMQSKVFEPLMRGKILICDPRVLSGYNFTPYIHYLPAKTGKEFMNSIKWVIQNIESANIIASNAARHANSIIGPEIIENTIINSIYNVVKKYSA